MGNEHSSSKYHKHNSKRKTSNVDRLKSVIDVGSPECQHRQNNNSPHKETSNSEPCMSFQRSRRYSSRTSSMSSNEDRLVLRKGRNHTFTNDGGRSSNGRLVNGQSPTSNDIESSKQFQRLRYGSVRGTSFEPKSSSFSAPSVSSSLSQRKSLSSSKHSSIDSEQDIDKLKATKKGKRIASIRMNRKELWNNIVLNERENLSFILRPTFESQGQPNEVDYHELDVRFLRIPDDKIEERQQLYDLEINFTEAKFTLDDKNDNHNNADRLVRGHTFFGRSHQVNLTEEKAVIIGNFINPEYGRMDFFTFELVLFSAHKRDLMTSSCEQNNNGGGGEPFQETFRELFMKRYYDMHWGTFAMKVRGSFTSKDYLFTITERPPLEEVSAAIMDREEHDVGKESLI